MILSAWGLSTVIWVPTINAWPYIEGKPNLDRETEMCFIQFVETNQFMSILCCMVAFYIPVSIMSGLYIRVWWETVKRQRDLVHLQAGKKASSKRSDSSEEVDPVRQGENPDVACNRPIRSWFQTLHTLHTGVKHLTHIYTGFKHLTHYIMDLNTSHIHTSADGRLFDV